MGFRGSRVQIPPSRFDVRNAPIVGCTVGALSARTVIVMAAEDEYILGKQAGTAEDDERRLLYVSLSRAKERLIITFATNRKHQQRHTGRTSGETVRNLTRYLRDGPIPPRDGNEYVRDLGR